MSKSMSSNVNGKIKTPDDTNMKILRELTQIPCNKFCFDCHQRGPTYVNITIGSFICMTCSGLLRGLTPPHRVKSISMASFTSDEIELLKSKGNEYCRKVWLATCSPKESNLGSDKNSLLTFMASKYEQKRFYVDPSKLSETELNEIQAQTARALTSQNLNLGGSSSSSSGSMQKSPSLSSTRSSNSQQSNPSPVLSKIRNNQTQQSQTNRLVNSITMPDIKSLSLGQSVPSVMTNQTNVESGGKNISSTGTTPNPINFINNLTSNQQLPISKINNNNNNNILNISPWGDSNGVHSNGNGRDNNFDINSSESNFADFEDAFSRNNLNGASDFFAGQNQLQGQQNVSSNISNFNNKLSNGNGVSFPPSNISMQTPILPYSGSGGGHPVPNIAISPSNITTNEDKYAALKDLDSLFKQTTNGDTVGNGTTGNNTSPAGLSTSASLPANLSSSGSANTGWFFSTSLQNPFFQAPGPAAQQTSNGWNGSNGSNPNNPFFGTPNSWKASPSPAANTTNSGIFASGPSHLNFSSPVSSSTLMGQAISTNSGKTINPFFATTSNPNNPFL